MSRIRLMNLGDFLMALIAVMALIATVVFGVINSRQASESAAQAKRSADSAEESLSLAQEQLKSSIAAEAESLRLAQQQLENSVRAQQDSLQPYVWFDLRTEESGNGLIEFVMGNSGPTVATDIRVEFQPALDHFVPRGEVEEAHAISEVLTRGIKSLAPGKTIAWNVGVAWAFFNEERGYAETLSLTIYATGPHGPLVPSGYAISLADLRHQVVRPRDLGLVEKPLKELVAESNDQNLWMVFGGVTCVGAPSRG